MNNKPNILIVLFDQLRYDVVNDPELCQTPTFDRLRQEGTWFARHYTPTGICSPARASLMTGLYPHAHSVLNNVHSWTAVQHDLPADHPTLGELLSAAGYRTGYVGKWHLGTTHGAAQRGFDDVRFPEGEHDPAVSAALEDYISSMVFTRPRHEHGQRFPIYLRDPVPPYLVPANLAFEGALGLLDSYADQRQPFCLLIGFPEPHHPTILTEELIDRYDPSSLKPWPSFEDTFVDKPRTNQAGLHHFGVAEFTWEDWAPIVARNLATVTMIDDLLGRLLVELDRLGRADDTLVVVTTDHGDMLGNHRQFNKGPLMYDDVYRTPLVIRAPAWLRAGAAHRVDGFTSHLDLLPTIAEAADVALPPRALPGSFDGVSLMPWLVGEPPSDWRTTLMCEFHGDEFGLYSQRMLRRDHHKLVYNPNDVVELYDLADDPHELRNLGVEESADDIRVDLEHELLAVMRSTGDGLAEFAGTALG